VLDSGFYKELKIFLKMTNRDIKEEIKKINLDDFDKIEFELVEHNDY
jgi:5-bromo-4-chloroindolyl phosphate hydrolysis protein